MCMSKYTSGKWENCERIRDCERALRQWVLSLRDRGKQRLCNPLVETTMSSSLPLEILDLIAGHLHDEPTALKACCLVSKSWVPRTRRHLFDNVEFGSSDGSTLESWMQTFPDPSNSPAHYTRSFSLFHSKVATATTSDALPWIRSFDRIVKLETDDNRHASFAQLRGLSPTLKRLNIYCSYTPTSEVLDFICSFPHLEDLSLSSVVCSTPGNADSSDAPPTLPKFNGSLLLNGSNRSITRKLLDLPGGLRFSKIVVSCPVEDCDLAEELVSTCSDTLEYLYIEFYRCAFPQLPWLINT